MKDGTLGVLRQIPLQNDIVYRTIDQVVAEAVDKIIETHCAGYGFDELEGDRIKSYMFLKWWFEQNPAYMRKLQNFVGNYFFKTEGPILRQSAAALHLYLVLTGRATHSIQKEDSLVEKRVEWFADLQSFCYNGQSSDLRLRKAYNDSQRHYSKRDRHLTRNVRGIFDLVGKYPGVIEYLGRAVSLDDTKHLRQ